MDYSELIRRSSTSQPYSPPELLAKFQEYIAHMNSTGLIWVFERVKYKLHSTLEPTPKRAPLTVKGFCVYAMLPEKTFNDYMDENNQNFFTYGEVASYIRQSCTVDFVNGAAVGVFNGNLALQMAREVMIAEDSKQAKALEEKRRVELEEKRENEALPQNTQSANVIRHELEFINYAYANVSDAVGQERPADLEQPLDVDALIAHAKELQAQDVEIIEEDGLRPSHSANGYDNKENASSRNHTMAEFNRRNNTEL